jgi:hypothetical protein
MTKPGKKVKQSQDKGKDKRNKKEKGSGRNTKLSELDDSRHVMEKLGKKKALAKGEDAPTYRPRTAMSKSKKREAELKAKEKGKKNDQ